MLKVSLDEKYLSKLDPRLFFCSPALASSGWIQMTI